MSNHLDVAHAKYLLTASDLDHARTSLYESFHKLIDDAGTSQAERMAFAFLCDYHKIPLDGEECADILSMALQHAGY